MLAGGLRRRLGRVRAARNGDDEGMSTVEAILTVPVMVAMVLAIVEIALWWYARQVAGTAADEAARTARAFASTAAAGESRGASYLDTVDPDNSTLVHRHVHVTRTATTVTVRVDGDVVSLLPFLTPNVSVTVTAPVERYVPAG
jgi:Flp pilus assembly protein TadG